MLRIVIMSARFTFAVAIAWRKLDSESVYYDTGL